MSTVVLKNEASVAAEIISVLSAGVIVEPQQDALSMEISVPNFGGYFRLAIAELDDSEIEKGSVIVRAAIDTNATMVVTLFGESDREGFHTRRFSFGFESAEKTAESDFRLATFRAALSLANQTRLVSSGLGLDHWFRLNEPLRDISEMLKVRQTMYRLMVIERAMGRHFKIPSFISDKDMEAISFLYHTITEGAFEWPLDDVLTFSYPASKDQAILLEEADQLSDFRDVRHQHQSLFGVEIPLGLGAITIIDKHIEDFDQVLEDLRKDDGRTVAVRVGSRIGVARYNMRDAPRLPTKMWNQDLQMLIDMEGKLDDALVQRYHALAAATLEGLTDEQKAAITARPELDEEAFSF
jgi:hypothetical protein